MNSFNNKKSDVVLESTSDSVLAANGGNLNQIEKQDWVVSDVRDDASADDDQFLKVRESIKPSQLNDLLSALKDTINNKEGRDSKNLVDAKFHVLEVGSAKGFSSVSMASVSQSIRVLSLERDSERVRAARQNIETLSLSERITIKECDASEELKNILSDSFDFAFLDGAKGQYRRHFDELVRIVRKGGTICIDNVNFHREEKRYKTINKRMEEFREYLYQIGASVDIETGFASYTKR